MLRTLENYYRSKGILSTEFKCPHRAECVSGCKNFTEAKSTFVGEYYEKAETTGLPRLLFLSLDPGTAKGKNTDYVSSQSRLPEQVRQQEKARGPWQLKSGTHWHQTHELAACMLKAFNPKLECALCAHNYLGANQYFAHVNSVKCCVNKEHRKKAAKILYENCRIYLREEIEILSPDIIVSQGKDAKKGIEYAFPCELPEKNIDYSNIVPFQLKTKQIIWWPSRYPTNMGTSGSDYREEKEKWESIIERIRKEVLI